jgi:thiamine biosynthesis lipoprotein ApbE
MRLFLALLAAVLLLRSAGAQPLERSTEAMGATFSVVLYGSDQASMNQAIDAAFEEAHRLDELLSNYRPERRVEPYQSRRLRASGRGFA